MAMGEATPSAGGALVPPQMGLFSKRRQRVRTNSEVLPGGPKAVKRGSRGKRGGKAPGSKKTRYSYIGGPVLSPTSNREIYGKAVGSGGKGKGTIPSGIRSRQAKAPRAPRGRK